MRIGLFPAAATGPADSVAAAARAAARGLDSIWTNQMPGGWDPLATLAAASAGPLPAEVGTAIVATYPRHPAVLAAEALTVSALTGGRLVLGVGPSHPWFVTDQLGLPYTAPAAYSREYLEVLRPLLRGEHVTFAGKHFTVDTQLSATAPPPPVLLSALGPRMLAVAADLADGTAATWVRPDLVADHLVPALPDGARVVVTVLVAVTDDPDGVREAVARDFAPVAEMPAYRAVFERGGVAGPADTIVAGSAEQVHRELARFRDAGTTDLVVAPLTDVEAVLDVAQDLQG
jgi:5,10-methylenetetrahydromethanopterin reductase